LVFHAVLYLVQLIRRRFDKGKFLFRNPPSFCLLSRAVQTRPAHGLSGPICVVTAAASANALRDTLLPVFPEVCSKVGSDLQRLVRPALGWRCLRHLETHGPDFVLVSHFTRGDDTAKDAD
jgi:hypothetical protein